MGTKNYLQDLQDIKQMMSKSTQFLSLSGLAGILAGFYALIGAFFVRMLIENHSYEYITLESLTFKTIVGIAILVLFLSLATAYFFRIEKPNEKVKHLSTPPQKEHF